MFKLVLVIYLPSILVGGSIVFTPEAYPQAGKHPKQTITEQLTNEPADSVMYVLAGVGELRIFPVFNTLQSGCYSSIQNAGEFPPGSEQYYLFSSGFWFGALSPSKIDGKDTTWKPCVSKSSYRSDLGAMSAQEMTNAGCLGDISGWGVYSSDLKIPEGYEGAGDYLFVQPNRIPEPYQTLWPFADTFLNKYLQPEEQLDPSKGDIFSDQSTYAVGGDWIPAEAATVGWISETGPYDGKGLGIRVEMRTYSWNSPLAGDLMYSLVLSYKIRNMNNFTFKSPCLAYFTDPDIGKGGNVPGDDGAWDDMLGSDDDCDLAYVYDFNGSEPEWEYPAGFIGVTLIEDPLDHGLTGLETWQNGFEIDEDGKDELKYTYMSSNVFNVPGTPDDARFLANSGPFPDMGPGEECDFILGVVVGNSYQQLIDRAELLRRQFGITPAVEEPDVPPPGLELSVSEPVPFHTPVTIRYSIPSISNVELSALDALGRKVETLREGPSQAGISELQWDASKVPTGVYFIRLRADGKSQTSRVLILK